MIVIPARLHSTRLPRKLMLRDTGKTVLEHTYASSQRALRPEKIVVAADHEEIASEVARFGGGVIMTSPAAASGTDRVAEVAAKCHDFDVIVNVQGDEPEIDAQSIDLVIELLMDHPASVMATLASPIRSEAALRNPACVKVVFDDNGRAIYFSRSPIPCPRDSVGDWLRAEPPVFFQHLGLYAYRREFLLSLASLPQSQIERIEKLEQLRVLSAGYAIQVGIVDHPVQGIDTLDDYRAFVLRQAGCKS